MDRKDLKILFASNDSISLDCLNFLHPEGVLTVKSKQSGRKKAVNPVTEWALNNNIECIEVEHLLKDEREYIQEKGYNLLISFSFSKIFGPKFLSIFTKGAFNIHPSSLPMFRGPSPIQNSILSNLKKTDITLQTISEKMDEGDIVFQKEIQIEESDDYVTLSNKIKTQSPALLQELINNYPNLSLKPQIGEATYTKLIEKSEGVVSLKNDDGFVIDRKVKAYVSFPKVRVKWQDKNIIILKTSFEKADVKQSYGSVIEYDKNKGIKVATKGGYLYISRLCLETKAESDAASFVNGHRNIIGGILS